MRFGVMMTALVLLAAPAQGFLLVGQDPEGDGNHSVLGVADVGDTISDARTDILGLDVSGDDEQVTLRLRFAAAPAGTGGYMYRTVFEAGSTLYWTCWTVQWVGGAVSEENVKGCSRFSEGTQVGPQVTGPTHLDGTGVFVASTPGVERGQVDGQEYVQWSVPRTEILGAGLADLRNVHADTWFRGGSLDDAGSTTDSKYHWSRSDLGPDDGFWSIQLPADAPALNVTLNATADGLTLAPGTSGAVTFAVNATGAGNVSFSVEGAPADWTVAPAEANRTAPFNTTLEVQVSVPADAPAGVLEMALVARSGNETLASVPLLVTVVEAEGLDADAGEPGADGNETAGPEVAADADTPGPGAVAALLVVGVVAVLRRRR